MTEMLLTEIDHVAIAVRDLDAAIAWYETTFGATGEHRETVESDGVEEALLAVADSYVQLLTPTTETSARWYSPHAFLSWHSKFLKGRPLSSIWKIRE